MTDETRSFGDVPDRDMPGSAGGGGRDAHLAALLAVAPLDELTRRRLVRRAITTAHPTPRRRLAAVASIAAAVALGVGVGAILVHRPEVPGPTTAAGNPTVTAAAPKAAADSSGAAIVPAAPINVLGNLGDVSTAERLRAAIKSAEQRGGTDNQEARQFPCASTAPGSLGLVATVAAGVGDSDGRPVAVLIGTAPDGAALAVVVRQPDCSVLRTVKLPN